MQNRPAGQAGHHRNSVSLADGWEVGHVSGAGSMRPAARHAGGDRQQPSPHPLHPADQGQPAGLREVLQRHSYLRNPPGRDGPLSPTAPDAAFPASVSKSVTSAVFCIAATGDSSRISTAPGRLPAAICRDPFRRQAPDHLEAPADHDVGAGLGRDGLSYGDPRNDVIAMFASPDPIEFILAKELVAARCVVSLQQRQPERPGPPGDREDGQNFIDFARENLFTPLGISEFTWDKSRIPTISLRADCG